MLRSSSPENAIALFDSTKHSAVHQSIIHADEKKNCMDQMRRNRQIHQNNEPLVKNIVYKHLSSPAAITLYAID